jgi:hypothetical protein
MCGAKADCDIQFDKDKDVAKFNVCFENAKKG